MRRVGWMLGGVVFGITPTAVFAEMMQPYNHNESL